MIEGLSLACVVHDQALAEANLAPSLSGLSSSPSVTAMLLDNGSNVLGTDTARLYNILLRLRGPRYRVFCHPDVRFPPDFAGRIATAIGALRAAGTSWGALGVVGRAWDGAYVWSHEVQEPAPVCCVDSCCLVVDTSQGLAFDDRTFDEFHCYVEDYCLQCHRRELGVFVVPAAFEHMSATYHSQGSRWGKYPRYRRRLDRKWKRHFGRVLTT